MQTPYAIFFNAAASPMHTMRAALNVIDRTYQVSIFHDSQSMALALANALRTRLDGYHGYFSGVCYGGIFYRAQSFAYEADTKLFHIITEWRILYRTETLVAQPLRKAVPTAVTTAVTGV
jgi:hypothetical protein